MKRPGFPLAGGLALAVSLGSAGAVFAQSQPTGQPQVLAVPEAPPVASVPQALPAPDLPPPQVPGQTLNPPPPGLTPTPLPQPQVGAGQGSSQDEAAGSSSPTSNAAASQPAQVKPVWLPRGGAILDVLDKEDGAITRMSVPAGSSFTSGKLRIKVGACVVRPADQPPDAAVYLVVKPTDGTGQSAAQPAASDSAATDAPLFRGWLIRSEPGAVVVGDATVTFRVIGCSGS
ncbi:MAG TPA: DUF2155 domain-containing protein [Acidiphilium sp.]